MRFKTAIKKSRRKIVAHDVAARKVIVETYFKASQRKSPPGIPVKSGRLRSLETPSVSRPRIPQMPSKDANFQRQSIGVVRAVFSSWTLGKKFIFSNYAHYAGIIARKRRGKVGSRQNPEGYHNTLTNEVRKAFSSFKWKGA